MKPELPSNYRLPEPLRAAVQAAVQQWGEQDRLRRLWARDASLWTGRDEGSWLGWLDIASQQLDRIAHLGELSQEVRRAGFSHLLLLGMGGSSLCPDLLKRSFGKLAGHPELLVLDSTDPQQVRSCESKVDLASSLLIVSSKSGTTTEPNIFKQYFFEAVRRVVGDREAGRHFIAITDPGSPLQRLAEQDRFRHTYFGLPSIGGRFSALSDFGMVPAAAMGVDVRRLLERALEMVQSCSAETAPAENPGLVLGAVLGVLARRGRDKVTLISSPGIDGLGAWLEQLLAESTGKQGKGLIPIDREPLGAPQTYGADRLFVYLRLESESDRTQEAAVEALEEAGQPVVRFTLTDLYDLGRELFRWELATAVAGSVLEINPFDQPDVEASKVATRKLTQQYERSGKLPSETPFFTGAGFRLYADPPSFAALSRAAGPEPTLSAYLRAHLQRIEPGDYVALLAYLEMNDDHEQELQELRRAIRDHKKVATCLGFGPRFLHSTGQAYKGGPNSGVFLQITCDDAEELPIPGHSYGFGIVKAAQARGDFEVLMQRKRRALRLHLTADTRSGLARLKEVVQAILEPE